MGLLFTVIGTVTSLFEGVFIKRYNEKHNKGGFVFTGLVSWVCMLFFVITDKNGFYLPKDIWFYALTAGVLYCLASVTTYMALGSGSFVITMLVLSYTLVFSIGYGLLILNEKTSFYTWIGLTFILISIYFMRGVAGIKKKVSIKWIICLLLSFFGAGMYGVLQRMQQIRFADRCTNEFMIIALGLSGTILLVIGIKSEKDDLAYVIKHGTAYVLGAGVANGLTNMLIMVVNAMIAISIAAPLRAGSKIIISFLISTLIFKERFYKRQILGVILGAIGLILLSV